MKILLSWLNSYGDFADPIGHGTAVAGVIRAAFPEAEIVAFSNRDPVKAAGGRLLLEPIGQAFPGSRD